MKHDDLAWCCGAQHQAAEPTKPTTARAVDEREEEVAP